MKRSELVRTLELIKPALATNNVVPVFQCFVFHTGSVEAYDDTIAICGPCEVEEECAIHGNTLLGLLSNSKADEVSLEFKGDIAVLTMGKSVSKLPFQPKENFIFEEPDIKWPVKIPFTESFVGALKLALETVSSDTTQLALLGVSVVGNFLYSCNGDAVTRAAIKQGSKDRVLLSTPFCQAVLRLWSALEITKGILCISDEWVMANFVDWCVYGRVLEIPDPIDFDNEIKKTVRVKTPVQDLPPGFRDGLSRACVLAEPENQKTHVTVEKGKLRLLTETHMGEVKDEFPFKGHPEITANVNASYMLQAIEHCSQMAIHDNCTIFEAPDVLILVSNMG